MLSPDASETTASEPKPAPDPTVRCRACGHTVTRRSKAIEVNGAHEHTFRNPAGYSFHVKCFSEAPGSRREGQATSLATWFAGFDWCFALCNECQAHLGWWYLGHDAAAGSFVGLIATRLA